MSSSSALAPSRTFPPTSAPRTTTCWAISASPAARRSKAEKIIESIKRKGNIKDKNARLYAREVDALDIPAMVKLIQETKSAIVINLGTSYINMSVLEACIQAKSVNGSR